jgi:hypothetical protein
MGIGLRHGLPGRQATVCAGISLISESENEFFASAKLAEENGTGKRHIP